MSDETTGLYQKYRPKTLQDVIGQEQACAVIAGLMRGESTFPTAILFTGPSGCGKTTLAEILATHLDVDPMDFHRRNSADVRGIDEVRRMKPIIAQSPIRNAQVWLLDECHAMTPEAQDALLVYLERARPRHHFMLCTTDPQKLKKTVRTRCLEIALSSVPVGKLRSLVGCVSEMEGIGLSDEVLLKIAQCADGSPRKAVGLLEKVLNLRDEASRLDALERATSAAQTINLCRALLAGTYWKDIQALLKTLDDEPETVRRAVLGYMNSVMLNEQHQHQIDRADEIVRAFAGEFFYSGAAGLTSACWSVVKSRQGART